MAGAGYKLFQTGDVLTAAQVNTYLNEQTVMVFANAAARTSALTSVLAEGMVSYLQDTNAVEVYNGSAWVGVSGAGDVTEVQAGTGISVASGTGPIPVVTNTMATAIDAEGDLIIGDAADAFQRLPIGSNTHVLTVDTSVDGKIKWAAPAGGGKVLQVVQDDLTSTVSTTSTSYVDVTGFAVTITPSSASSKVLIICSFNHQIVRSGSPTAMQGAINLVRTSTQIQENIYGFEAITNSAGGTPEFFSNGNFSYLDSPNTTSAVTYKVQQKAQTNMTAYFQASATKIASIIAMEIGA